MSNSQRKISKSCLELFPISQRRPLDLSPSANACRKGETIPVIVWTSLKAPEVSNAYLGPIKYKN